MALDHWVAALLAPLACWVVLNGLDEVVIDAAALIAWVRRTLSTDPEDRTPTEEELDFIPERRMAILVALWEEHRVIRTMIETNAAKLKYSNFDFFVGTYPNDPQTIAAVRESMKLHPNVHLSVCPHDGPTSKADCLNWIYQRMLLHEAERKVRFDMVIIHDAEDIIDPDALRWINYYGRWNDMVQMPILALATPPLEIWHGIYCDEFADFQFKDMQARDLLGGFIPSTGVGAGFSRRALEQIAEQNGNRIFEPQCLTEDYEIGVCIHALGLREHFVPIHIRHGRPIATREYFPRVYKDAKRQRSRWVMGIALQSWEFHSARETLRYLYWFWRDRKGLISNLLTPLANLLFLYGGATWILSGITHHPWGLAHETGIGAELSELGASLQLFHMLLRACFSARIYGWRFAAAVPVRALAANWLNGVATARAIRVYASAKISGKPLRWIKTRHIYPSRAALMKDNRPLGELLVALQMITPEELEIACSMQPRDMKIGEYLVASGFVTERELYAALARHHGIEFGSPAFRDIAQPITRMLPVWICRRWQVAPFRIHCGELYVATVEFPDEAAHEEIRRFTSLGLRFQMVTPGDFAALASRYLTPHN